MGRSIMTISVEEDGKAQYRVLRDGKPLGTLKVLNALGGVDAVQWTSAIYTVSGYAPSPDVAIARIQIAATGHHELAEETPADYYVRPHNASDNSDAKHVARRIGDLLDMLSFFGSSFIMNGGNGTLQQDSIRLKDKVMHMLRKEGWNFRIPRNEYIVDLPANRDPHDWTLRSVINE